MVVEMGPHMQVVYRYEVKDMNDATLDHEWEEISLGSIGESINQESWALQGVRVLDRTKQQTCRIGSVLVRKRGSRRREVCKREI